MFRRIAQIISVVAIVAAMLPMQVSAATMHTISGTVLLNGTGFKGVLVTVKGTSLSATTNGLGNYVIHNVPNGSSGVIKPVLKLFAFNPVKRAFANIKTSLTGQDFTATQVKVPTYTISGKVMNGLSGLAGVTVTFAGMTSLTNNKGVYSFLNIPSGTRGRIQPKLAGFGFSPAYISVEAMGGSLVNQDFSAFVAYTISGKVTQTGTGLPLAGVTVSLGSYSAVTNVNGAYTMDGVLPGTSGDLTPSLAGETFTPPSIAIVALAGTMHGQNFVAAP